MSNSQGWDSVWDGKKSNKESKSKSNSYDSLFMKLPDGVHKIRLIGKQPEPFNVAWIENPYRKEGEKPSKMKVIVPDAYIDRLKSCNIPVRENYGMLCFDRADTKKGITRVKILEKGPTLFRSFKAWGKAHADDEGNILSPGDLTKGPDWHIEATVPKNIMETSYSVTNLDPTPISKVELEFLKKDPKDCDDDNTPLGERGPINLKEYYANEKDKALKILDLFFEKNNSLDSTESVDSFIGDGAGGITSLDDLPSLDSEDELTEAERNAKVSEMF